jgi:hypothetical protein
MGFNYIGMRVAIPSGGSYKVTIPLKIVDEVWKKKENFLICFIQSNGNVILEPPELVMRDPGYSDELKSRVNEDMLKNEKKLLIKKLEELYGDSVKGMSRWEIERRINDIKVKLIEMARFHEFAFSQRELHFIHTDKIGDLFATLSINEEQEKEEEFLGLMDEVKKMKEEVKRLKDVLVQSEKVLTRDKLGKDLYEKLRERYIGKLTLAEQRLNRLKSIINDP